MVLNPVSSLVFFSFAIFISITICHMLMAMQRLPLCWLTFMVWLSILSSWPLSSITLSSLLSISLSPNSLPLCPVLSLSSQHLFITPCLPILTLSTLHSIPCDSVSHFLHSPYYPVRCPTLSLVVYKSFQLVVYSLACNCHPLLPTQSPPSLPPVSYQSLPWQYNPLVSPLLNSSKIKDKPVPWWGCNT